MENFRSFARSIPLTFESWMTAFVGVYILRTFFEQYSNLQLEHYPLFELSTLVHYGFSYLMAITGLMVILLWWGRVGLREALGVGIIGVCVLWMGPIVDLIIGGFGHGQLHYFFLPAKDLFIRFITFYGLRHDIGLSWGIHIEILFSLIITYLYIYNVTKSNLRALGGAISLYFVTFIVFSLPSLVSFFLGSNSPLSFLVASINHSHLAINNLNQNYNLSFSGAFDLTFNKLMSELNAVVLLIFLFFLFWLGAREKFLSLIKNSRPERLTLFFLFFLFGFCFSKSQWNYNWADALGFLLAYLSVALSWIFSVCQNDIYDMKIDKISNINRPLIAERLSKEEMILASKISLFLSLTLAYAVSVYCLSFVGIYTLVYYLYSNPPLRLKRFVFINSFLVGLACLSVVMDGFFLRNLDKNLTAFSPIFTLTLLIFFTIVANVRDLKDYDGDKSEKIMTLPVLLGLQRAKRIISISFVIVFLIIPWYFSMPYLWIPAIIASVLSWKFTNQKVYKEIKVFLVYIVFLITLIGSMIFK